MGMVSIYTLFFNCLPFIHGFLVYFTTRGGLWGAKWGRFTKRRNPSCAGRAELGFPHCSLCVVHCAFFILPSAARTILHSAFPKGSRCSASSLRGSTPRHFVLAPLRMTAWGNPFFIVHCALCIVHFSFCRAQRGQFCILHSQRDPDAPHRPFGVRLRGTSCSLRSG